MRNVFALGRNTVREVVRERVVVVLALFGVGLAAGSQVLSPLALGEGRKVVADFGLAAASLLATLLALVLGPSLLHKEVERRTIYAVVAKPIRRIEFLLGKFFGLWATATLLLAGMTGLVLALLTLIYGETPWNFIGALVLTAVEIGIVTAIVVLFSAFTTPALTAFFAAAAVVAGHFTEDLLYFGTQAGASALVVGLTRGAYWLLPHLDVFNARGLVVHGLGVSPERLAFALAYGLLYIGALLVLAGTIFERREFR